MARRTPRQRGTAYIEYLLAAVAAAAAAMWLFSMTNGVRGTYEGRRDAWMTEIAGPASTGLR